MPVLLLLAVLLLLWSPSSVMVVVEAVVVAPQVETDKEVQQDVFLQCLMSLNHADDDQNDRLTRTEFQDFVKDFSQQLYSHPIFGGAMRGHSSYLTNEMRDLFKLLVQADGGDPYKDNDMDITGCKVEELMHLTKERYKQLHTVCMRTVNAFSLLAKKAKPPKKMIMEMTMVEGQNINSQEGMTVQIKPWKPPPSDSDAESGSDSDSDEEGKGEKSNLDRDSEGDIELHGTHMSLHPKSKQPDASKESVEESVEEPKSKKEEENKGDKKKPPPQKAPLTGSKKPPAKKEPPASKAKEEKEDKIIPVKPYNCTNVTSAEHWINGDPDCTDHSPVSHFVNASNTTSFSISLSSSDSESESDEDITDKGKHNKTKRNIHIVVDMMQTNTSIQDDIHGIFDDIIQDKDGKHKSVLKQKEAAKGKLTDKYKGNKDIKAKNMKLKQQEKEGILDKSVSLDDLHDGIDSIEEHIQELLVDQTQLLIDNQNASSRVDQLIHNQTKDVMFEDSSDENGDADEFAFVWEMAWEKLQYNKNKKLLEEYRKALLKEKKRLVDKEEENIEKWVKSHVVLVNATNSTASSSSSQEDDDESHKAGKNKTSTTSKEKAKSGDKPASSEPKKKKEEEPAKKTSTKKTTDSTSKKTTTEAKKKATAPTTSVKKRSANTTIALSSEEEVSSSSSEEEKRKGGAGKNKTKASKPKPKKTKTTASASSNSTSSSDSKEDFDDLYELLEEHNMTIDNHSMIMDLIFADDDDDVEISIDEDTNDKQILSIHTSFIIFNFENASAADIAIDNNSSLGLAFDDYVTMIITTVCDKAGIGAAFGNCSKLSAELRAKEEALVKGKEESLKKKGGGEDTKTKETEGNSRRTKQLRQRRLGRQNLWLLTNEKDETRKMLEEDEELLEARRLKEEDEHNEDYYQSIRDEKEEEEQRPEENDQRRQLEGAEYYTRKGVNFEFTVMNPELYAIEDIDCPMADEFPNKRHPPKCQIVFGHYNLLLTGLDGNLRTIENNYNIITASGIKKGRLRDSLQMVDPTSIHHIEGPGVKPYPTLAHHKKDEEGVKKHHAAKKKGSNAPTAPTKKKGATTSSSASVSASTSTSTSDEEETDAATANNTTSTKTSTKKKKHEAPRKGNQYDRRGSVEEDPDDPNWEKLINQEGYKPNPEGLYAEEKLENSLVGAIKQVGEGVGVVGSEDSSSAFATTTGKGAKAMQLLALSLLGMIYVLAC